MPRFTTAYSDFLHRCDEVLILVKRAAEIERSKAAFSRGAEIDALCRGAIVLLSSHIEAYVKELGECLLDAIYTKRVCRSKLSPTFFYHASKEALEKIRDGNEPNRISAEVFRFIGSESEIWRKVGQLPRPVDAELFNQGFANPKLKKVKRYLARFGYNSLQHDLNTSLMGNAVVIASNLDQIVDVRNAIAHGEASATKTPSEVKDYVCSATIFCRIVDISFGDWCKFNVCTIR